MQSNKQSQSWHFVGNLIIDSLKAVRDKQATQRATEDILCVIHKDINVLNKERFSHIVRALGELAKDYSIRFVANQKAFDKLEVELPKNISNSKVIPYEELASTLDSYRLVISDSSALQDETSYLGVPCLSVLPSTHRLATVEAGTNIIVDTDHDAIIKQALIALKKKLQPCSIEGWDGQAAERACDIILGEVKIHN